MLKKTKMAKMSKKKNKADLQSKNSKKGETPELLMKESNKNSKMPDFWLLFPLDQDNLEELMDISQKEKNSNSISKKSKAKENSEKF